MATRLLAVDAKAWIAIAAIVVSALFSAFTLWWTTRAEKARTAAAVAREDRLLLRADRRDLYLRILQYQQHLLEASWAVAKQGMPPESLDTGPWHTLRLEAMVIAPQDVQDKLTAFGDAVQTAMHNGYTDVDEDLQNIAKAEAALLAVIRAELWPGVDLDAPFAEPPAADRPEAN